MALPKFRRVSSADSRAIVSSSASVFGPMSAANFRSTAEGRVWFKISAVLLIARTFTCEYTQWQLSPCASAHGNRVAAANHFPMHQSFSLVRMKRLPSLTAMLLRVVSPALPIGTVWMTLPSASFCTTAVPRSPMV